LGGGAMKVTVSARAKMAERKLVLPLVVKLAAGDTPDASPTWLPSSPA
jgi:hypothetical protein